MRIVVCIKQVPATTEVSIDPETKRLVREGVEIMMNPFDTYALEEALLLREKHGGEVIALSMGPKRTEVTLREAIACGADKAILLNDRALGGSDTFATSYALSQGIREIMITMGKVDLVICGKQAIDGDTAQVGPGIAAHLGWPQATYVSRVLESNPGYLILERMHEEGYDTCRMRLPGVITVLKDINQPRVPTLRGRLAALKATINLWNASTIKADVKKIGLNGSPTRVVGTRSPDARDKQTIVLEGSPIESARELVKILKNRIKL